jgi:hypothetical protein
LAAKQLYLNILLAPGGGLHRGESHKALPPLRAMTSILVDLWYLTKRYLTAFEKALKLHKDNTKYFFKKLKI